MLALIEDRYLQFIEQDDGKPIVMLNLLRFRPDGGRERYGAYLEAAGPLLARYGASLVYSADGLPALSAEDDQAWDAVVLVRYPSRKAFSDMISDPDYRGDVGRLRVESLSEAVLQPLYSTSDVPGKQDGI